MASTIINWSEVNSVLTPSFLMSVAEADRFTAERIGQQYNIQSVEVIVPEKGNQFELLIVSRGTKTQKWGLKTFLRNVLIKTPAGNVPVVDYIQSAAFSGFKVVEFEPSVDMMGVHMYSKGLIDPIKRSALYPVEMEKIQKGEATMWNYASVFNANIEVLAFDMYIKDGKLTQEAITRFQLGTLIVEVF